MIPDFTKRNRAGTIARKAHPTPPPACEDCGSAAALDRHHDDYDKPEEIRWLCRKCHRKADAARWKRDGSKPKWSLKMGRTASLHIRLSPAEQKALAVAAASAERTVADYARLKLLRGLKVEPEPES